MSNTQGEIKDQILEKCNFSLLGAHFRHFSFATLRSRVTYLTFSESSRVQLLKILNIVNLLSINLLAKIFLNAIWYVWVEAEYKYLGRPALRGSAGRPCLVGGRV